MSDATAPLPGGSGGPALQRQLDRVWRPPPGLRGLSAVNHTYVGRRFVVTGMIFFLIGGVMALLMRAQLIVPENELIGHALFNQLFTMHGTTMMFLFAVPIMEGAAAYLIPLMVGTRDLPFPRLSAYGYWCYLFGGIMLYSSFLVGAAPDGGWFMYTPLTGPTFSPDLSVDFWLLGITFVEISAITAAIELVIAILKTRAPGMSIDRMPIFCWYILVMAFMILLAFPPLIIGSILLEIERAFGLPFFDATQGGDPLLWQHLFWMFGHPEVYIIFLPAAGIVSSVIPTFMQRPLFGYTWLVLAAVGTGFLSFGLWAHHMFTVGMPHISQSFFSAASMAVAIPAGIQVFTWIANLWGGRPRLETPMLFVLGFLFIFVLGGLTGVMVASAPFDWQVHDTYFLVAHFHYVLIGGAVFPLFAGLYYWMPNATGRMLSDRLGKWTFWLMFLGFNITFFPMHQLGLMGMPRRVYTYPEHLGWDWLNLVASLGAVVFAAGVLVFLADFARHFRSGRPAGENPWNAGTLEWLTPTPLPSYNFRSLPWIQGRDPMWQQPDLLRQVEAGEWYLADPSSGRRELLGTGTVTGRPECLMQVPGPSWLPLIAAATTGMFFVSFLMKLYEFAALGGLLTLCVFLIWLWHSGQHVSEADSGDAGRGLELPRQSACEHSPGLWGMRLAILTNIAMFLSIAFVPLYLWTAVQGSLPGEPPTATLTLPVLTIAALLASSAAMQLAVVANRRRRAGLLPGLLGGLVLGLVVLALAWATYQSAGISPFDHAFAASLYTLGGFHLGHLVIALIGAAFVAVRSRAGYVGPGRDEELRNIALFWHYVMAQGLITFAVIHIFPRIA